MLNSFQTQSKLNGIKISSVGKPLKSTISSSSLYGTDVVVEEYRQLVNSLARHVVYGRNKIFSKTLICCFVQC